MGVDVCDFFWAVQYLQLCRVARTGIASLHQLPCYSFFVCLKMESSVCRELHIAQCCHDGVGFATMTDTASTLDMCIHISLKLRKYRLCPFT